MVKNLIFPNWPQPASENEKGYITLLAMIVTSGLLIVSIMGLSRQSLGDGANILTTERKVQSRESAVSCANLVLLNYAFDPSYRGNETISINENQCSVQTVKITDNHTVDFLVTINSGQEVTNLNTTANISDLSIMYQYETIN